ncbi:ABC transporter substrate-binding protein [Rhodococcus artemisiae]|uniref:ABC transporter substrate-binding protein n=1 Tax=Rhodococcus artemisiae TaxID=714159 RepID=A0ABU7LDJ0_9NOCA|nr:ABC transporter substrate-binding protein [Rhodococcus artemisiae]MEE2059612.1 ABC transporter substrate-binding protein [Rhodococcus artemisiae]
MFATRSRRRFGVGALVAAASLAMILTGCSSPEPAETAPTEAAVRTVTDGSGEVEIPVDVERIVTIHHIATQPLINLGVVPVGRGAVDETSVTPETWEQIEDVPVVSNGSEPDIEQIATLEPDLIIAHNRIEDSDLAPLREIAPVLVLDIAGPGRADWQGRVELVAQALGKEDTYEQLVTDFDERTARIAETHRAVLDTETFALLGSWNAGTFHTYSSESIWGSVFTKAGARIAPAEEAVAGAESDGEAELSVEQLPVVLDGTVLLHVTNLRGEPNAELEAVMAEPLFQAVPAVVAGTVLPGGKDTVGGFEDANYNLDLFEQALTTLESQQG